MGNSDTNRMGEATSAEGRVAGPGDDAATRRVRAVLALSGVRGADLDDAAQQVQLKFIEHRSDPARRPIDNPAAWAAVTASRIAVDVHRSRTRDTNLRTRLAARWQPATGHDLDSERATALDVADGLDQLSAEHRQAVILRYYADMRVADIAAALDIPEGTVKSRLHAAHRTLREFLHADTETRHDHT